MAEGEIDTIFKYIPYVTTITKDSSGQFPNVEFFFKYLLKNTVIETKPVGRAFRYSHDVESNKYYSNYGIFMDYFIRKHVSNQLNVEISDSFAEDILNDPNAYIIGKKKSLHDSIAQHYEIYKDPKTEAMDIIRSIKITSFSHSIYFGEQVPRNDYTVDENHLREIIVYCKKLPYSAVKLYPDLRCEYFKGHADLIFDDDVIYEIKTSKFKYLGRVFTDIPKSKFYQHILYAFGFYKNYGIKISKFKIYNPLLGYEHSIALADIDFELFEKALKRDVAVYSRFKEIREEEMVLDLSLFSQRLKVE